jgi:flagellar biosynthesis/type III secretory pathway chaperone
MNEAREQVRVPAAPRLDDLIGAQLTAAENLAGILEQEYRMLAGDVNALAAVSVEKVAALARLECLHREYCAIFAGAPMAVSDGEGTRTYLQELGGDVLVARWQQLGRLVGQCREANRANGVAIERSRRHVDQALAVVRGRTRAPGLYGANGVPQAGDSGSVLARA